MIDRRHLLQGFAASGLASLPFATQAQAAWPTSRPIRMVVAFPPGGPADIIARLLGEPLQTALGQTLVIENRGGAAGSVGSAVVAKAEPDGYTVLVNTASYAVNPSIHKNLSFDSERDLTMVALVASGPNLIVGSKNLPANTLKEAMALAKNGKFSYSSAGAGTTPHLSAEYLFKVLGKLDVTHVPYQGAGPAVAAVLGSQVELGSVALPAAVEHVKSGSMKAFAVTSTKRVPSLPDVPTVAESGFPDFQDVTWVALFVPSKTPMAIAERINREVNAIVQKPAFLAKLAVGGFDPMGGTLPELKIFLHNDLQKWAKVVKETGAVTD